MRHISKWKKKRIEERLSFDQISQVYFNYFFLFFNSLIFRGLKLRAFTILRDIKSELKVKAGQEPSFIFLVAMLKITPSLILRPAWLGGTEYGIPFPITY
jgi:ribosomal protein S7